ncbi:MAG: hypothetical protein VXY83_00935 [Pseudomonadota bacterium]|nr:hypothetical protein [Pseudomonadota bacterium]MEC8466898.1 hypothetical protein [Pseudomonadota bacterium]
MAMGAVLLMLSLPAVAQIRDLSSNMVFQISGDEAMRLQDD